MHGQQNIKKLEANVLHCDSALVLHIQQVMNNHTFLVNEFSEPGRPSRLVQKSEVTTDKAGPQWPRCLRRRSAAACLLRLRVRIPSESWMFVCFACCVFLGKGLCDELITRPEESYRLWWVCVCDLRVETSWMRRPWPTGGYCSK